MQPISGMTIAAFAKSRHLVGEIEMFVKDKTKNASRVDDDELVI